jgi:uncharacterized protein YbjT (DUF2867 family)
MVFRSGKPPARIEAEVAVTGATGRVGAAICAELAASGYEVRKFSHRAANAAKGIPSDVTQPVSVAGAFDGCSALVHCAGAFRAPDGVLHAVNALGPRRVLKEAMSAHVRHFLPISWMAIP